MAADVHECEECGQMCDCDGEDIHNPQPDDCVHHDEHCLEPDDEDEDLTIEA